MKNPQKNLVSKDEIALTQMKQFYIQVNQGGKLNALCDILQDDRVEKAIIFCRTRHETSRLADQLYKRGFRTQVLHAGFTQAQRDRSINEFKHGRRNLLVATDVAARGLDIEGITHIINYDVPHDPPSYFHRIGRTARKGDDATAITWPFAVQSTMTIMGGKVISVGLEEAGDRVDSFLARKTGITRSQIKGLIEEGHVLVNDKRVSPNYRIKALDNLLLGVPEQEPGSLIPEAIPLSVLHVDDHLVVVDKPAGMVVYPAAGHGRGTLMNALAFHCSRLASVGGPLRPGVVHRLDKETSGVMVVALDDGAYYSLVEQFRQRTINRRYITLVWGDLKGSGVISSPIGRSESDRKKMSTKTRRGNEAVTRWKALKRYGVVTLLEVKLGTGRTHQIRVHFSSIGHPVI